MSSPSKDVTGQYGSVSNNHLESLSVVVSNDVEIKTWFCQLLTFSNSLISYQVQTEEISF